MSLRDIFFNEIRDVLHIVGMLTGECHRREHAPDSEQERSVLFTQADEEPNMPPVREVGGKMVVFLKKHTDIQEIIPCIDTFKPETVHLYHSSATGRSSGQYLKSLIESRTREIDVHLFDIDFHSRSDVWKVLFAERDCSVLCLNLFSNVQHYTVAPWLYRNRIRVQITDGFVDTYGLYDAYRMIGGTKNLIGVRAALLYPVFWLARADYCFNPLFPLPLPLARRSLPTGEFPMTDERRAFLQSLVERYAPENFIFGGYDLDASMLARATGIGSYIATTKDRKIICNGEEIPTDGFICAEEIIPLIRPRAIIGTFSTALIAGKLRYPDVSVLCIESPGPTTIYGRPFVPLFRKNAERLGIVFPDGDTVAARLENARNMLEGTL